MNNKHTPFGLSFTRAIPGESLVIPYNARTQTAAITDEELRQLAASENTLTFTAGKDNDFDD